MENTTTGKLIAIVGPTASGKTALSVQLAEKFGGEIVCADSRTIFRGMDIGTAKPTREERERVPHHLLDVVDPDERLSAAVYKALADEVIADIRKRGRVPFLVGGSGLYVDSVLFDYQFPGAADESTRAKFEAMTIEDLAELLLAEDPQSYGRVDNKNRRRLIRALETAGQERSKLSRPSEETLMLGLRMNKEVAQRSVEQRIEKMLAEGFIEEVKAIGERYGWDSPAFSVIGYKAFRDVALEEKSMKEGVAEFVSGDMALYKKQVTWFKRNPHIVWLDDPAAAEGLVRAFLATRV